MDAGGRQPPSLRRRRFIAGPARSGDGGRRHNADRPVRLCITFVLHPQPALKLAANTAVHRRLRALLASRPGPAR
jgi:hypothetical protein